MTINLYYKGLDSGLDIYAVLYNEDGTEVYDEIDDALYEYANDDNPYVPVDPNRYGLVMTENPYRLGFYSAEVEGFLADGNYSFEVWEAVDPNDYDQTTDRLLSVESFAVKDGAEFVPANIQADISIKGLSSLQDLQRSVARLANKAGGRKPR